MSEHDNTARIIYNQIFGSPKFLTGWAAVSFGFSFGAYGFSLATKSGSNKQDAGATVSFGTFDTTESLYYNGDWPSTGFRVA